MRTDGDIGKVRGGGRGREGRREDPTAPKTASRGTRRFKNHTESAIFLALLSNGCRSSQFFVSTDSRFSEPRRLDKASPITRHSSLSQFFLINRSQSRTALSKCSHIDVNCSDMLLHSAEMSDRTGLISSLSRSGSNLAVFPQLLC